MSPVTSALSCRKSATAGTIRDSCDNHGPDKRDKLHHPALDMDVLSKITKLLDRDIHGVIKISQL